MVGERAAEEEEEKFREHFYFKALFSLINLLLAFPLSHHIQCETIKHHPQVLDIFLRYTFPALFVEEWEATFPSILTTPHFPIHSRPVCCLSFFFSAGTHVSIKSVILCLSMFRKNY